MDPQFQKMDRILIVVENDEIINVVSDKPAAIAVFNQTTKDSLLDVDCWKLSTVDSDFITDITDTEDIQFAYDDGKGIMPPSPIDDIDEDAERYFVSNKN